MQVSFIYRKRSHTPGEEPKSVPWEARWGRMVRIPPGLLPDEVFQKVLRSRPQSWRRVHFSWLVTPWRLLNELRTEFWTSSDHQWWRIKWLWLSLICLSDYILKKVVWVPLCQWNFRELPSGRSSIRFYDKHVHQLSDCHFFQGKIWTFYHFYLTWTEKKCQILNVMIPIQIYKYSIP